MMRIHARLLPAVRPTLVASVLLGVSFVAASLPAHATPTPPSATAARTSTVTSADSAAARFDSLRLGDRGDRVRFTQRAVDRAVTGRYGPPTKDSVKRFQRHRGMSATGIVNYRTWQVLKRHWERQVSTYRSKYRRVLSIARAQFGDPYAYGGAGPNAFDCSGLTMYVYQRATGISLPHSAGAQYQRGQHITRRQARPGDLVFFHSGSYIYHAAIWAGNGYVLHSSEPGRNVGKSKVWSNNIWFARFIKRP